MKSLIDGAYDLHVHSAPDVLPRKMDDLEMAQRIIKAGMKGYAAKSHYFCTAERAALVNQLYPECHVVGTITLNNSVGGINPSAVEMAGRAGAKIVWFPTCDGAYEQKHVFSGDANKKLPYWAQIVIQMKEEGIITPTLSVLENGKLTDNTIQVLEIIAKHKMILATAHLSHGETLALVKEAKKRNVERIIVTHVDFPTTFYTIEEQKELVALGAYMEHVYTTWATGKVDFETTLEQIKAIGADHVVLGTDLGQPAGLYPDEGLLLFAQKLVDAGIKEAEVEKMTVHNNTTLLK
ncbi:DUF6282 family protein [Geosporobacter ferrireducens]|uniref:Cytosolic protein n=1 Tax=Geosporobacter ferrireducens TaxID=1424294 RepID=A0A1D8GIA9_9FIRM|nr:DUF6282 family protein [Geosporobacter ferrireducens]AOT70653.1 cytosolic protein [Geosporobacter ferrireducens]MTI57451.1 cytosolic protein [Geosporobacter ferrireducens]